MPTFTPPTRDQGPLGEGRFFGRYKLARGISIYVQGNEVTEVQFPWQGTVEQDGVTFYAGGHVHEITDQEAAILIAAGYAAFIEGAEALPDDDYVLASSKGQPNGVASLNSSGTVPVGQLPTLSPGVHNHDAADLTGLISPLILPGAGVSTLGAIRLAGDLGGTATAPTVPALLQKSDVGHGHAAADITSGVFDVGVIPDLRSTYLGVSTRGVANGVAPLGSDGKVPAAYLSSGSSGGGSGATVLEYALTSNQPIPLPEGTFSTGDILYAHIRANGADRVATADSAYRLSTNVGSRAFSIPSGQVAVMTAQYSSLISAWVILEVHYSSGTSTPGFTLSAGADATQAAGVTFSRTATEPSGATITARSWNVISGPMGEGTTVGNAAALSWVPGSSVNKTTTTDIRQPVCMEMCFEIVSTAENSTTDWTSAYDYIEDIGDQRGYTGGLIGFTSATADMLELVEYYATQKTSGNILTPYISGLQTTTDIGYGEDASDAAEAYLGQDFLDDWATAANTDAIFRRCQRELRKQIYWDEALSEALADNVGPLGLALHYDILVNHGPGEDSESYGGIIAAARASTAKPPSAGGGEAAYLIKLCDLRDDVLQDWGDFQEDGRSTIFRALVSAGKLTLLAPFSWSVYGGSFSITTRPDPPTDGVLGSYVLRYTATGAGSDDVTVTVT